MEDWITKHQIRCFGVWEKTTIASRTMFALDVLSDPRISTIRGWFGVPQLDFCLTGLLRVWRMKWMAYRNDHFSVLFATLAAMQFCGPETAQKLLGIAMEIEARIAKTVPHEKDFLLSGHGHKFLTRWKFWDIQHRCVDVAQLFEHLTTDLAKFMLVCECPQSVLRKSLANHSVCFESRSEAVHPISVIARTCQIEVSYVDRWTSKLIDLACKKDIFSPETYSELVNFAWIETPIPLFPDCMYEDVLLDHTKIEAKWVEDYGIIKNVFDQYGKTSPLVCLHAAMFYQKKKLNEFSRQQLLRCWRSFRRRNIFLFALM